MTYDQEQDFQVLFGVQSWVPISFATAATHTFAAQNATCCAEYYVSQIVPEITV